MRKLDFASLQVRDLEVSKAFYTTKLGFRESALSNAHACVFEFNKGEASFAIRTPLTDLEGKELGIGSALWFAIDEKIEDLRDSLTEKQVAMAGPISTTPFGETITLKDPDGYTIVFLQPKK